jgi:hypothetical protein
VRAPDRVFAGSYGVLPKLPPARRTVRPGPQLPPLRLPAHWAGTHATDGLWTAKTAVDILRKPGTPVISPVGGKLVYWRPQGAQGGGAIKFLGRDGRTYFLAHVMRKGLPPLNGKIRPGQVIAQISPQHKRPHAHWDVG